MMTERDVLVRNFGDVVCPQTEAMIESVYEHWYGKSYHDVAAEMPEPMYINIPGDRKVQTIEVAPTGSDHDITRDIVLGLPYLNGYTVHHYIRAKTLQLLTHPNSSVWIMPNNGSDKSAYQFNTEENCRLSNGDIRPLAEMQLRAFENSSARFGTLAITGYSQGGLTAVAMAAVGSDKLVIDRVNADEMPSRSNRTAKQLGKDFMSSGGLPELKGAVKDANIAALSEAMSTRRLGADLVKFGVTSLGKEAKLLKHAMSGSAQGLIEQAMNNGVHIKVGSVAGSSLLDIESIDTESPLLTAVQYVGQPFDRRHATGDNVIAHAIMANDGLRL